MLSVGGAELTSIPFICGTGIAQMAYIGPDLPSLGTVFWAGWSVVDTAGSGGNHNFVDTMAICPHGRYGA